MAWDKLAKITRLTTTATERGALAGVETKLADAYATLCREQADRALDTARKWVRYAVWHGGPTADYRARLKSGAVPRRADPER